MNASLQSDSAAIRRFIPIGIFLATFLTFLPALHGGFVWDDNWVLSSNSNIQGFTWPHLRWMFTINSMPHYFPLTWLSFALDFTLWGMNPRGFHLTSILLHALDAVVLYFLTLRLLNLSYKSPRSEVLGPRSSDFGLRTWDLGGGEEISLSIDACFAALFFSIHPLRVESVAWITERCDALSGLFFLLALLCYLEASSYPWGSPERMRRLILSTGSYALSLLSKEIGVTLPFTLLILDAYPLRKYKKEPSIRICLEKLPYFILALMSGTAAILSERSVNNLMSLGNHGIIERLAQATYGLVFYLSKTICPLQLSPFYAMPHPFRPLSPQFTVSALAVAMITWIFVKNRREWPWGLPIWAYYILTLSPVLGFLQFYLQLVADRYSYLPSLGWAVLAGAGMASLWRSWFSHKIGTRSLCAAMSGALAVLAGLSVATWRQTKVWHDDLSLWKRTAQINPNSFFEEYELTLEMNPNNANAHNNLGALLALDGKLQEAIPHFQKAVSLDPNNAEYRNNLQKAEAGMAKTHNMGKGGS